MTKKVLYFGLKIFAGPHDDSIKAIELDQNGNLIIVGPFYGTVDMDPGAGTFEITSNGEHDIYILKLTVDGEFVWVKHLGGIEGDFINGLVCDPFGSIHITGTFNKSVDFDPGPNVEIRTSITFSEFSDVFLLKLNSSGAYQWVWTMGFIYSETCSSITLDSVGNIYGTGFYRGVVDFISGPAVYNLDSGGSFNIFVFKMDASGQLVWAKDFSGGSSDWGQDIVVDQSGSVYTTGGFQGTVDFDPSEAEYPLVSKGGYDVFINKLDNNGAHLWTRSVGGIGNDHYSYICLNALGDAYIAASAFNDGSVEFDSKVQNTPPVATHDSFIQKIFADGNFGETRFLGGAGQRRSTGLLADPSGEIYLTGQFTEEITLALHSDTYHETTANNWDSYILKLWPDLAVPIIVQNSPTLTMVELGSSWVEPGATATDAFGAAISVHQSGDTVDSNAPVDTIFYRYYDASDDYGGTAIQSVRTVTVVDTTAPEIILYGTLASSTECGPQDFQEPGYDAIDPVNGDITEHVTVDFGDLDFNAPGTYTIRYNVQDASENPATEKTRTVEVVDTTPPIITLIGSPVIVLRAGVHYIEPCAMASDACDGDISNLIAMGGDEVNIHKSGVYVIIYDVSDSEGHSAISRTRTIIVEKPFYQFGGCGAPQAQSNLLSLGDLLLLALLMSVFYRLRHSNSI